MFEFLTPNKLFRKLKIGDVLAKPFDSEASKAGFHEYAEIEYYYKIVDISKNGLVGNRYLGTKYGPLPAGLRLEAKFNSANTINKWLKSGHLVLTDGSKLIKILAKNS